MAPRVRVSAPGKLMISGEYVVLEDAPALVAAVGARLYASGWERAGDASRASIDRSPDGGRLPAEALLARQHAEVSLGETTMELTIDASELNRGDRKLGLGSSAAASAASAGAVLAWHGEDPAVQRREILRWALAGHRAVAPEGSGADVAAATLGGIVRFVRAEAEAAERIAWPRELDVKVVWTGRPARTSELVRRVRRFELDEPARYRAAMDSLREAADELLGAIEVADTERAVRAADAHGDAMGRLGDSAGAPIVTEELERVAQIARSCGGGAKPSGAGGGDVALAFFSDVESSARFEAACGQCGLTLLSLALGADGVRAEET